MKPDINVTPLIDILLVLLIIFMVISPIKTNRFETRIPSEQSEPSKIANPDTLIVRINSDFTLALNQEDDLGTINEPRKLSERLRQIFNERLNNDAFIESLAGYENISIKDQIQKNVFIKAPKSINYREVVKVIDELKYLGANPNSLQIDDLEL